MDTSGYNNDAAGYWPLGESNSTNDGPRWYTPPSADPGNVLAVPHERLPWADKTADAMAFWVAVDCLRADEHEATEAPDREQRAEYDPWFFGEEATGELWHNRAVADPEHDR